MRLLADNPQPSGSSPLLDATSPAVHYDHSFVSVPSSSPFSSASSLFASAFGVPGVVSRGPKGVDGAAYQHLSGAALPISFHPASFVPGNATSPVASSFSSVTHHHPTITASSFASSSSSSSSSIAKRNSTAIMKEEPEEPQLVSSDCEKRKESKEESNDSRKEEEEEAQEEEGKDLSNGKISQFTEVPLTGK